MTLILLARIVICRRFGKNVTAEKMERDSAEKMYNGAIEKVLTEIMLYSPQLCLFHICCNNVVFSFPLSIASRKKHLNSSSSFSTPPLTPDKSSCQSNNSFTFNGIHPSHSSSRSSFGSIGHDEAFPPPPSPTCMSKFEHVNNHGGELSTGCHGRLPWRITLSWLLQDKNNSDQRMC